MLLLLLAHTSRCEPCKSLLGSLATTPLVDFHHRRTACPSYNTKIGRLNKTTDFFTMTALLSEIRQNHLDEAPQEFETVEDDDDTADNVDNTQCFVIEFGTE